MRELYKLKFMINDRVVISTSGERGTITGWELIECFKNGEYTIDTRYFILRDGHTYSIYRAGEDLEHEVNIDDFVSSLEREANINRLLEKGEYELLREYLKDTKNKGEVI